MLRRRTLHPLWTGFISALVTSGTVFLVLLFLKQPTATSQPSAGFVSTLLSNGLATNLLSALMVGALATAWGFVKRGLTIKVPIRWTSLARFEGDRKVIRREDFIQVFQCDAGFSVRGEDGWLIDSRNVDNQSLAMYRSLVRTPVSVTLQVKPYEIGEYWRAGIILFCRNASDKEPIEYASFHIDSHNLVNAYLQGQWVLHAPACDDLRRHWALLSLQLSHPPTHPQRPPQPLRVFGHLNGKSYDLGVVPFVSQVLVGIKAWSDHHRKHQVLVRDVSISPTDL